MARRVRKKKTQSMFGAIVIEIIAFAGILFLAFQASANRKASTDTKIETPQSPITEVVIDGDSRVVDGTFRPNHDLSSQHTSSQTPYHLIARSLDTSDPSPTFAPSHSF